VVSAPTAGHCVNGGGAAQAGVATAALRTPATTAPNATRGILIRLTPVF
jgi:hypothetical protein